MELLNEVAHISGKPGLFKVLKPTRTGVIVETLDAAKQKSVVGGQTRISVLKDISLYLADHQDSTLPLADLFLQIHAKFNGVLPLEPKKAADAALFAIIADVVPNYDSDRVFASDIKKILSWYLILFTHVPELFPAKAAKAPKAEKVEAAEKEPKAAKKPAAKKAAK
ncbi:MAG: Dephospho-CoA kinase [Bacteroidota bacterium]|jgi:Domain of unknown function (DUF5606)